MKRKKAFTLFALFLGTSVFCLALFCTNRGEDIAIVNGSEYISPANNRQYHASVWLGKYKNELFFAVPWGKKNDSNEGWLCRFRNGKASRDVQLRQESTDHIDILGMQDRFLYYYSDYYGSSLRTDPHPKILCCDVETGEISLLYSPEIRGNRNVYFADDSSISIPLHSQKGQYYLNVFGSEVLGLAPDTDDTKQYTVGDWTYYLRLSDHDIIEHVMARYAGGEATDVPLGDASQRSLIKTESGLLIHNYGRRDLLYYLDKDGAVVKLFSVPCSLSESSITVYHNSVYLSVMRYEKGTSSWSGMVGYKNDDVKGTYRIDLNDYSIEKVSDMIFDGMYIFDDTGIFACTEDNRVYKLDFDCTVIKRLL